MLRRVVGALAHFALMWLRGCNHDWRNTPERGAAALVGAERLAHSLQPASGPTGPGYQSNKTKAIRGDQSWEEL
jgi:hypothetical protein